jgi:DNA polymerase III delta subunit
MRNSGETSQITNMDELFDGIQILYGVEALTSGDREAATSLVDELAEFRGEKGLNILRSLARGEVSADDARKMIYAPPY